MIKKNVMIQDLLRFFFFLKMLYSNLYNPTCYKSKSAIFFYRNNVIKNVMIQKIFIIFR